MLEQSALAICVAMGVGALFLIYLLPLLLSHTPRKAFPEELIYQTISKNGSVQTGKLYDVLSRPEIDNENIELSVVVPSYNETGRITSMLTEAIEHLKEKYSDNWEILIVDDGSKDGTADYCLKLAREKFKLLPGQMRVVSLVQNRGKGGAVRHGMMHVRGKYALFADADGASKFSDVEKLLASVKKNKHANGTVAIGSRSHMVNTDAVVKRSLLRNFLMYGLHILVYVFGIRYVADTQCGFKLFDLEAIRNIYPFLHTEGWIFDVELLLLAERKGIPVDEIPISWHEVSGSKVALTRDSICMTKDLVVTRLAYLFGIYSDNIAC